MEQELTDMESHLSEEALLAVVDAVMFSQVNSQASLRDVKESFQQAS